MGVVPFLHIILFWRHCSSVLSNIALHPTQSQHLFDQSCSSFFGQVFLNGWWSRYSLEMVLEFYNLIRHISGATQSQPPLFWSDFHSHRFYSFLSKLLMDGGLALLRHLVSHNHMQKKHHPPPDIPWRQFKNGSWSLLPEPPPLRSHNKRWLSSNLDSIDLQRRLRLVPSPKEHTRCRKGTTRPTSRGAPNATFKTGSHATKNVWSEIIAVEFGTSGQF